MSELQIDNDKVYSTKDVARLAGLSDDGWIRRLLLDGRLEGQKVGRQWVVYGRDVKRWLAERQAKSDT